MSLGAAVLPVERRKHRRFPISFQLQYQLNPAGNGCGEVHDISSYGLCFRGGGILPLGQQIEVNVPWPFLLDGRCRLQLRMEGQVVRSDRRGTAIAVSRHEFRTIGKLHKEDPFTLLFI